MGLLDKLAIGVAKKAVIEPVVKKTIKEAEAKGVTGLKSVTQLTNEIVASKPIQKFGKESGAIITTAAIAAGGFAAAPALAAAAGGSAAAGGAAAVGGKTAAAALVAKGSAVATAAKGVISVIKPTPATKEEYSPPQQVKSNPMGLLNTLSDFSKTDAGKTITSVLGSVVQGVISKPPVVSNAAQQAALINPKQNQIAEPKLSLATSAALGNIKIDTKSGTASVGDSFWEKNKVWLLPVSVVAGIITFIFTIVSLFRRRR